MPTLAELELLHGSMRDLGNTFYRNRVLGQQAGERDLDRKMREEEMGLRREESSANRNLREREFSERGKDRDEDRKVRADSAAEVKARHDQMLKTEQGQQAIKQLNEAHKQLQESVDTGRMTPAEASAKGADIQQAIQTMGSLAWDNSNFGLVGHTFKKSAVNPGVVPQRLIGADGKETGWVNPKSGHFEIDKPPQPAGSMTITTGGESEPPKTNFTQRLTAQELDERMRGVLGGKPPGSYESLPEARAAGRKKGDIIQLFDPAQKKYRPFRME